MCRLSLVLVLLVSLVAGSATSRATLAQSGDWTTYRNARHGYMIGFPTVVFEEEPQNDNADGRMMVSRDGTIRLLVGAFPNDDNLTLEAYRNFLIENNYASAKIDYAPVRQRWFVLSGVRDGTVFYERVTFTCGGRLINSWALLYPESEGKRLDRLVEQIARSYAAGAGPKGDCRTP